MQPENIDEFAVLMAGLAENFGAVLSEPGIELRFNAMENFTIEQVREAALSVLRTKKISTMPTAGEMIEAIVGNKADIAEVEAGKVLDAIKRIGSYESVVFDDPVTMATIKQGFGGWVKMCQDLSSEEEKWFLKDFVRIYQAFARREVKVFGRLVGTIETQNSASGYEYSEPVLVGDQKKARLVLDTGENRARKEAKLIDFLPKMKSVDGSKK